MRRPSTARLDLERPDYVDRLLDRYCRTPGAGGRVHRNDRHIAHHLFERSIPLEIIEAAFDLAALRRLARPPEAPPLSPIRSLAYFLPVIEELLSSPPSPDYYRYLRQRLQPPHPLS